MRGRIQAQEAEARERRWHTWQLLQPHMDPKKRSDAKARRFIDGPSRSAGRRKAAQTGQEMYAAMIRWEAVMRPRERRSRPRGR